MAVTTTQLLDGLGPDTLVKVLRANRTHYELTYALGRNECPQSFNDKECADGGLYACRLADLLHWVSLYPDIDTVAVVEVPPDARTKWFDTKMKASALVLTRFLPLEQAIHFVLEHGANGDHALRMASRNGHLAVVQCLLAAGANVHANDDEALRWASENGHTAVVERLLTAGADVHANGDEALWWASANGHLAVVQHLLAAGANVHALNDGALQWASANGHTAVVERLIAAGARIPL